MHIVPRRRFGSLVLGNPSIQNRNVHSRLGSLKFFRKALDRLEVLHVDFHHLDLRSLNLLPNLSGSGLTLLQVSHPKYHPRLMFHVRFGGFEAYAGVRAGDEDGLTREVDICWDLWDGGCELFDGEGDWSVRVERESVFIEEAECKGCQECHVCRIVLLGGGEQKRVVKHYLTLVDKEKVFNCCVGCSNLLAKSEIEVLESCKPSGVYLGREKKARVLLEHCKCVRVWTRRRL